MASRVTATHPLPVVGQLSRASENVGRVAGWWVWGIRQPSRASENVGAALSHPLSHPSTHGATDRDESGGAVGNETRSSRAASAASLGWAESAMLHPSWVPELWSAAACCREVRQRLSDEVGLWVP